MSLFLLALVALVIALLVSSIGFVRVVYFVSTGYGFSVSAIALGTVLLLGNHLSVTTLVHLALLFVYGIRLGWYIVAREKTEHYGRERQEVVKREGQVAGFVKVAIWISVSLLYVLMTLPALVSAAGDVGLVPSLVPGLGGAVVTLVGLGILAGGLLLETVADAQKNRFKKSHPQDFCSTGVFRWVRCPNYLGEIFVWVGNLVAAVAFLSQWYLWVGSALGLICIVLIMMGSTKRLEAKQDQRYGQRSDYQQYIQTVPVLIPFVPVYSLKGVKVFLE